MRAPETVLTAVAALVLGAPAAVAFSGPSATATRCVDAYSRDLLAPGLGRRVDLEACARAFDPRVGACGLRHEPSPGADVLCAGHARHGVDRP